MNTEVLLPYHRALKIYLEIYNYPVVIKKYIEYGLSNEQANELASKVSNNIADYENSIKLYKGEIYGGLAFLIVGAISAFLILTRVDNYEENGIGKLVGKTIYMLPLGVISLIKGLKDLKIVKLFNKNVDTPFHQT